MSGETIARARGRWREILPRLGIETRFLSNRHGPCPLCGGVDRFRFDDRDGEGTYFCNQCGAGNGIIMLRKRHGWTFKEACDQIDAIIGTSAPIASEPSKPADDPERRRRAIEKVIRNAQDERIVERYLDGRGLAVNSSVLLGHPSLWHVEAKRTLPAVVAPIHGPDGTLQSVQRIYVGDAEPRKMTMPPVSTIKGGAVRLFPAGRALGVAEGVETSLAAHQLWGIPVWATLSDGGMTSFEPPAEVERILVFGDSDSNFVGQAAAYSLAKRLHRDGITAEVHIPDTPDTDWLDVLNEGARP